VLPPSDSCLPHPHKDRLFVVKCSNMNPRRSRYRVLSIALALAAVCAPSLAQDGVALLTKMRQALGGADPRRGSVSRGSIPASKWHYLLIESGLIENRGHHSRNPERS
jgi:hypothetical protein